MRRIYSKENLILIAVLNKIYRNIRSIAIKDKQLIGRLSLRLSTAIKHLFKPREPNIVIYLARGR